MNSQRLSLHAVAALLSSVMLVLLGASSAHALPASHEEGSMTIHRLQGIADEKRNSGLEDSTIDFKKNTPVSGATFTLQRIDGVDFSAVDGWKALEPKVAAFTPGDPGGGYGLGNLGDEKSFVTSASGLAVFSSLPEGAYLVRETAGATAAAAPVDPFIVTIPMAHPLESGTWNYDVHVYPESAAPNVAPIVAADHGRAALSVENIGQDIGLVQPFAGDGGIILMTGMGMLLALVTMVLLTYGRAVSHH